jgi:hypothetical protein
MCGAMLLMAAVATGVDAGWQLLPDGGMEYIIQIEPHSLQSFQEGREIICDIPPDLKGIRSYRLRVGTAPLPREAPPVQEEPDEPTAADAPAEKENDPFPVPSWPPDSSSGGASALWPSTSPGDAPRPFEPASTAGPVPERQAVYNQPESQGDSPVPASESGDTSESKPWLPFTLALAAFFGAFGGMLYTGWIAWDYRRRYQTLLEKTLDGRGLSVAGVDVPDSMTG